MLATDAPFGLSDDPQERSKRNGIILISLLYTGRGARQLRRMLVAAQVDMGRSTGSSIGVARGASRLGVFEEENFLCGQLRLVRLAPLVEDHRRKDGQSRRAAIEFGDRLLQDLAEAAVNWGIGVNERQDVERAIEVCDGQGTGERRERSVIDAMRMRLSIVRYLCRRSCWSWW